MKTLCIDLGGTRAKLAVVEAGRLTALDVFPTDHRQSMAATLETLTARARALPGIDGCAGIGFAYPGIVDTERGRVVTSNEKYLDANRVDFVRWARDAFGLPILISNDAAAAICGEMAYGSGRGFDDAVMMMIGTGIGTAAYSRGKPLTGRHGTMGILGGHIAIAHANPRRCTCGNWGCLEAYAGTWALDALAREAPDFAQSCLSRAEKIDYRAINEGRLSGDALCARLFRDACDALCVGAVNLVHAYDPEILILGGGASHIPEIRAVIARYVAERSWTPWGTVSVTRVENPEASVVLGLHSLLETRGTR